MPDPVVELLKLPVPVVPGAVAVWLAPAVPLPGATPVTVEPHGRPIASVRSVVLDVPPVDGLVPIVPDADGPVPMVPDVDGFDGAVVDVPAEPPPVPDDVPALLAAPPDAPLPAPPPCASASPALPASRIAAINEIERDVFCIANS